VNLFGLRFGLFAPLGARRGVDATIGGPSRRWAGASVTTGVRASARRRSSGRRL